MINPKTRKAKVKVRLLFSFSHGVLGAPIFKSTQQFASLPFKPCCPTSAARPFKPLWTTPSPPTASLSSNMPRGWTEEWWTRRSPPRRHARSFGSIPWGVSFSGLGDKVQDGSVSDFPCEQRWWDGWGLESRDAPRDPTYSEPAARSRRPCAGTPRCSAQRTECRPRG